MSTKEIRYDDPKHYLQDYEVHLRHGGLLIPWAPSPPLHALVELILLLPPDQNRVRLKATVVSLTPQGVGVQFEKFGAELRAALEQNAEMCRNIVSKMSQTSLSSLSAVSPSSAGHPVPAYPSSHGFTAVISPSSEQNMIPPAPPSGGFAAVVSSVGGHTISPISIPGESSPSPTSPSSPNIQIQPYPPRSFSPSVEDWNRPDQESSQDVVWSSTDIPVPSDLYGTDTGEELPQLQSYSSPEIDSPFVESNPDAPVMRYPVSSSSPFLPTQPTLTGSSELQNFPAQPDPSSSALPAPSSPSSHTQNWLTREPVRSSHSQPKISRPSTQGSSAFSQSSASSHTMPSPTASSATHPTARTDLSAPNLSAPASSHSSAFQAPPPEPNSSPATFKPPVISPPPGSGIFAAHASSMSWETQPHSTPPTPSRYIPPTADRPSLHPSVAHITAYPSQELHSGSGSYGYPSQEYTSSSHEQHPQAMSLSQAPGVPYLSQETLMAYEAAYREMQNSPRKLPDTPSWVSTFSETPILRALNELAKREATGLLEAETSTTSGEHAIKIYMYQGKVLLVEEEPTHEDHLLGNILVKDGRINSQERENAIKKAREQQVPLGEVLTGDKIIAKRELSSCLRKQMQKRLGHFTEYAEGSFRFWEKRLPRDKKLAPPTSPVKLLFRHKMDMLGEQPYDNARQIEDTYMDRYLFPAPDAADRLEDLGLLKDELYFWENMITGRFRLRQIYAASNFRHRRTYVLVFALHAFDFFRFEKEMSTDWQVEEMRDFFRRRHALLGEETFFELLGIHWTSSQKDIEAAYKRIRRDYDISNYEGEWPQDITRMSTEILNHLEKVHDQLLKGQDRREYRKDVLDDVKLRFSYELFEQQGDMAVYRRDFADAIERYERALEINPSLTHLKEKILQAKAGLKKYQEAIQANAGKTIDYSDRMKIKINTETLFKPDKQG